MQSIALLGGCLHRAAAHATAHQLYTGAPRLLPAALPGVGSDAALAVSFARLFGTPSRGSSSRSLGAAAAATGLRQTAVPAPFSSSSSSCCSSAWQQQQASFSSSSAGQKQQQRGGRGTGSSGGGGGKLSGLSFREDLRAAQAAFDQWHSAGWCALPGPCTCRWS